jgi:hypothetical protein
VSIILLSPISLFLYPFAFDCFIGHKPFGKFRILEKQNQITQTLDVYPTDFCRPAGNWQKIPEKRRCGYGCSWPPNSPRACRPSAGNSRAPLQANGVLDILIHHLLKALRDPKHPEHAYLLTWAGDDYDPEFFDADVVNKRLKKIM